MAPPTMAELVEWAYSNLGGEVRPARVEVGAELLAALEATAPEPPPDDEDHGPRLPHHRLMGVPLFESDTLEPFGWRTLDRWGTELRHGHRL